MQVPVTDGAEGGVATIVMDDADYAPFRPTA
jgi:hypothetical protein